MLDRLVIKENDIFAVTDRDGNIRAQAADGQGLYLGDTRFLSVYELQIDEVPVQLLASAGELNFMNNFQFGNLQAVLADGTELPTRTLSVRRNRFIDNGLHERVGLFNYGANRVSLKLRLTFGSDFRDMFDVRGYAVRARRGTITRPEYLEGVLRLGYRGLDQVQRTTEVRFDRAPSSVDVQPREPQAIGRPMGEIPSGETLDPRTEPVLQPPTAEATFDVFLEPAAAWWVTVDIDPVVGERAPLTAQLPSLEESFAKTLDQYEQWKQSCTEIVTDHETLNLLIRRSLHDLRLTINHLATGLMPVAGIPWFAVPFGRDSLVTSLQTLMLNPDIAYGTLRFLARHQGKIVDPWRDEEPGKILHEIRSGEMAALGEVPQTPYYGSVDSTPLFVFLFTELLRWTNDEVLAADLRPHLDAALEWIRIYGDRDGDGLVEYHSQSSRGISNQGWKDSYDSVAFPDRQLAQPPIAMAEVQGYCYAAEARMADVYRTWGDAKAAERYERSATRRHERYEETFWLDSLHCYAEALDGLKVPVPAVTTNPGHNLLMGMLTEKRTDAMVERLMEPDMLCGWGFRTLSGRYPTFNPMSYHNGSVWPHDNSIVIAGLRRAGYPREALRAMDQIIEAAFQLPDLRMPELYCGFSRDRRYQSAPAAYPVSCMPQSWAAGSVFLLMQHLVGLEPDLPHQRLNLCPLLPKWLNDLRFERVRVGNRSVGIHIWRERGRIFYDVTGADGLEVFICQDPRCVELRH